MRELANRWCNMCLSFCQVATEVFEMAIIFPDNLCAWNYCTLLYYGTFKSLIGTLNIKNIN